MPVKKETAYKCVGSFLCIYQKIKSDSGGSYVTLRRARTALVADAPWMAKHPANALLNFRLYITATAALVLFNILTYVGSMIS